MQLYREYNFDGIVGPTYHYGGLSFGNLASTKHGGLVGNPRAAALEGLEKMRLVASLGVGQAVLPPGLRPPMGALTQLGYPLTLSQALGQAYSDSPSHLSRLFSASSMWTANAATVFPSCDTDDQRLHLLVANLSSMAHRSLEAPDTYRILRKIFAAPDRFEVHPALPAYLPDEGAANQLRLYTNRATVHLLGWGKSFEQSQEPQRFVARQALEASRAGARLCRLRAGAGLLWQQSPRGIDGGAFHSDVLAVSNEHVLLMHEAAFVNWRELITKLEVLLGGQFVACVASSAELPVKHAVASYPFNSQLVSLPSGEMALLAPTEAKNDAKARAFLARAQSEVPAIEQTVFIDVNSSMKNGGGPACLRLRVMLSEPEREAISARVFFDDALYVGLKNWVLNHYRSELSREDFQDPALVEETCRALDELTQILDLGSVYQFQINAGSMV